MEEILRLDNITHQFTKDSKVLRNISFTSSRGEITLVEGPNGSGKTTLLKICAGLLIPSKGKVFINKNLCESNINFFQEKIGWVSSDRSGMFSKMTGKENLEYYSSFYNIPQKSFNEIFSVWSENKVFQKSLNTPFYLCSMGMKTSLLMAKSTLHKPDILILDEPLNGLDTHTSLFVIDKILEYSKHATVLITGHNQEVLKRISKNNVKLTEDRSAQFFNARA